MMNGKQELVTVRKKRERKNGGTDDVMASDGPDRTQEGGCPGGASGTAEPGVHPCPRLTLAHTLKMEH